MSPQSNQAVSRSARIFISYRRQDCQPQANGLNYGLSHRLPGASVFMDIDSIPPGEDFEQHIRQEIEGCDIVLTLIGDNWLDEIEGTSERRIDNPDDFVRLEIEAALQRGVKVIPVLVEGADMPRSDQLPESIRRLARINAIELSDKRFTADMERLASLIEGIASRSDPAGTSAPHPEPVSERVAPRQPSSIDFDVAKLFVESIPAGRWASYKDVSLAGGSATGAMAVGQWLLSRGAEIQGVWRVLNNLGEVSEGWAPDSPDLPTTAEGVRERLRAEGVVLDHRGRASPAQRWSQEASKPVAELEDQEAPRTPTDAVIVAGKSAYPDYLLSNSYICQSGRSFRDVGRIGFYLQREIKPEIPKILHRRDGVLFDRSETGRLRGRNSPFDQTVATLIQDSLDSTKPWRIRREPGQRYQVFLLTGPGDDDTLRLPQGILHAGPSAWTQNQRYVPGQVLLKGPQTTDCL